DVYAIGLNGKNKVRLSSETGTNKATFSSNYQYFINSYSSATQPPKYTLVETKTKKQLKIIVETSALLKKLSKYDLPEKEFFVLKTEGGQELNAWMIKPMNFDPSMKYPVLMHQYSGPGS